jgi:hypothetical protein
MCGCTNNIAQVPEINNQTCIYTFDQLVQALAYTLDQFNLSIVRSALSWYSKDCNKFNTQLNGIIH